MPSACPKCHRVLDQDEICCAQIRYTWKCKQCHKLSTGFALPYGKCFLCGGDLAVVESRELGDPMRLHAIRDAVQFELNAFYFYKLARERATEPQHRLVLEWLFRDLAVSDESSILRLYQSALEMECRTRDHFRKLAAGLPEGLEKELCQ